MNVFLTGSTGGIGSKISKTLIDNNINVIQPDSSELDLQSDISKICNKNLPVFDGFIHCAAKNDLCSYDSIDKNKFIDLFNINTMSFIELCKNIKFNTGANIIAIGSLYSIFSKENRIQYSMSKHALSAAVKTLALELSIHNIKINMISPGFIDTELTRKNNTRERIEEIKKYTPLGLIEPDEIAKMCLYFIKENKYITGQNIIIDGGYSLRGGV